ncbi:MAG: type II secretion system protein [Betaproteobacteria bacterium]|nr:type II secretion system protein [Betaproteobacteria bacterium]
MRTRQQGFTMIELIMVIVILGVLSAVAMPRFFDLSTDARMSKMQASLGALKSASAIAHSAYLVAGTAPTSVTLEGSAVPLVNGYPDVNATAASSGIAIAAGGLADYTLSATATVLTIRADNTAGRAACAITYTEALNTSTPPVIVSTGITAANCD